MLKKLGRGLDSLIEQTEAPADVGRAEIPCSSLRPNPYQPRELLDEEGIRELAASIAEHGVLQPPVVRRVTEGYEIVAGERRWRACQSLGMEKMPVTIRDVSDHQMLELALIENVQREDLNAIEKARAYRRYLDELGVTHEEAARKLGKDRSTITNQLRLLDLSDDLQAMVSRGTLSMGHARALLSVGDEARRRNLARRIEADGLSVRETERQARDGRAVQPRAPKKEKPARSAHFEDLERRLREKFATRARIDGGRKKGRITLEYYSMEELTRLLELLL
jgi:ParB family transcriptional regulator, chromosome partitioning protein